MEKKQETVVPGQFLDQLEQEEMSRSSSDKRTMSMSPQNIMEEASGKNHWKIVEKINNLGHYNNITSSNKSIDHESTGDAAMRKARVSVRARSQAPLVCLIASFNIHSISLSEGKIWYCQNCNMFYSLFC